MKVRISYVVVMMVLLITSCKKYLETDSPSTFTSQYIFQREDDIFRAVKGIYALLTQDAGYSTRVSFYYTVNSDVEMITGASDGGRRDIAEFTCGTTNSEVLNPWNTLYQAIDRANQCIQGIQSSSLYNSDANVKHMYGEAITLRALLYYELVRNWGDVPFKTTPTVAGDNFYLPRTDRDTILTHVINDLIAVEPNMFWTDDPQFAEGIERINRDFVDGLIARIALARGGYSLHPDMTMKRNADYMTYYKIANDYCKRLIATGKHTLNPSFRQIFLNECQYKYPIDDDVLYEIAFPGTVSSEVGYYNGVKIATGSPVGSASGAIVFPPTYFYSFDTLDTRQLITCAVYSLDANLKQVIVNPAGGITTGKWSKAMMNPPGPGSASTKGTGINWPLMRYSDVLLMYAETENEINNGPTADAKNSLALVRERAFPQSLWPQKVTNYIDSVSANHDAFFNAIVNERAWEFGGECIRKFDLVRWNLYGQKIAQARVALTQMGLDAQGTGNGTYSKYPDNVYWILNSDGTLNIKGLYRKVTSVPNGYSTQSWLLSLNGTSGTSFISNAWAGYPDNTGVASVRYILPIHQSVIAASLGSLQNYYNY